MPCIVQAEEQADFFYEVLPFILYLALQLASHVNILQKVKVTISVTLKASTKEVKEI